MTARRQIIEQLGRKIAHRFLQDKNLTDLVINEMTEEIALCKTGNCYQCPEMARWYTNATDKQYFRMVHAAKKYANIRFHLNIQEQG